MVSSCVFGLESLQPVACALALQPQLSNLFAALFPGDHGALTFLQQPLIIGTRGGAYLKFLIHFGLPVDWPCL